MRAAATTSRFSGDRSTIATYADYAAAQKAVDLLADVRFPVEKTAIVADDIRFVEQVTSRRGFVSAAAEGALSGGAVGAFVGLLLGFLSLVEPIVSGFVLAFWGFVVGAAIGLAFGLIGHALNRGRRDFASVGAFRAGHFDVVADPAVADEARKRLHDASLLLTPKR